MNFFPIYHLSLDFNLFELIDNILTICALCLAYWQFRKQNEENRNLQKLQHEENRKLQRQQNEKNWYINVIVVPQLDNINLLFKELVDRIKSGCSSIDNNSHDYVLKARLQRECNALVASYLEHIVQLVSSYDATTGSKVSEIEMALQDEATRMLENPSLQESDIRTGILKYNGMLVSTLFQCSKKE